MNISSKVLGVSLGAATLLASSSIAFAAVPTDSQTWNFDLTLPAGTPTVVWTSSTAIGNTTPITMGLTSYDWVYTITTATANVGGNDVNILSFIQGAGEDVKTGTAPGVATGPISLLAGDTTTVSDTSYKASIDLDAGGNGVITISEITLGSFNGTPFSNVKLGGTLEVDAYGPAIPEPASMALLGLSGLMLLHRRK
ncbi:PEP-CTERM sorting domain-containing protein [Poriferisphaera sp. WC338]|uniref:PEP-CTERM sorting domain-containing protein n=1 Tax=Poriferisphaera sp. WC338 TaxID=3425129 RepID=UPI003D8154F2